MLWMHRAYGVWNEGLHRTADQVIAAVAEQPLRLSVDERDPAVAVDSHDRVRRRLQQPAELRLRALAIADVAHGGGDEPAVLGLDGVQADLRGKFAAVLASSR